MMVRREALVSIVVVSVLGANTTATASKRVSPLTMEQLATAWVGGTTGGGEYARLDILSDGSGTLAVQYLANRRARGYRVTRTVLNGYSVHFRLEPAEDGAEPIFLSGRGYLFTLELRIGGTSGQWKRALTLERLSDVAERLDAVGTRIQELRAASDNRGGV